MRVVICLAARGVVRDVATNNISVFSILERFKPEGLPFVVQEVGVLAVWKKDPGDPEVHDCEFVVRNGDDVTVRQPIRIDFAGTSGHRTVITLGGVVVKKTGELQFEFVVNNAVMATYAIEVAPPDGPSVKAESIR